ncbi:MAG: GNAT family N-acetyltransferase [Myxococcales bacterium]|nr:GNAT family N-acetyltransferase [Myxococcales bacterium]
MGPTLRTTRLRISDFELGDAERLQSYRSHPAVARFQGWSPSDVDDASEFIRQNTLAEFNRPGTWYQLAMYRTVGGELIGDIGLRFLDDGRQVELGCTIAPAHQRFGYAKEGLASVIEFLFSTLDKHRLIASIDPENKASVALFSSLGFIQEGHFRKSILWKGEWVDDLVFAVLKAEWRQANRETVGS